MRIYARCGIRSNTLQRTMCLLNIKVNTRTPGAHIGIYTPYDNKFSVGEIVFIQLYFSSENNMYVGETVFVTLLINSLSDKKLKRVWILNNKLSVISSLIYAYVHKYSP